MKRMILAVFAVALAAATSLAAGAEAKLDWTSWDTLPVLHNGRVMPLDTFARSACDVVCGRESPRLDLKTNLTKGQLESPEMAAARSLFPDGKARKFKPSELLLSWVLEPEKWERVPFIEAKHEEARKQLKLPLTNADGEPIAFASPYELRHSDAFEKRLREIFDMRRAADAKGEEPQLSEVDKKIEAMWQGLRLWSSLGLSSEFDRDASAEFMQAFQKAAGSWRTASEHLGMFLEDKEGKTGLRDPILKTEEALQQLATEGQKPDVTVARLEGPAQAFAENAAVLADRFRGFAERIEKSPPEEGNAQQMQKTLALISKQTDQLATSAKALQQSIYASGDPLRVAPALYAGALEKERDPNDRLQPWIDLKTLLYGTSGALAGYPPADVREVRDAFAKLQSVYQDREKRPNDFSAALAGVAKSLRQLGEDVEPVRAKLPAKNLDQDLLAYTRYPAVGGTSTEVRYNRLQPFQWSWVVNLIATCIFAVYMIGIRRRSLFNAGLAILLAGLVWAAYGFYMRVVITGWAPVTNMYETVIFVPFFVAIMGAWFAMLPVTLPGLTNAWRLTAVPGAWEATELSPEQTRVFSTTRWNAISMALVVPRAVLSGIVFWMLAIAPYSAGGRTVINLLPNIDAGKSLPDANDLMTWAVGLCVLLPAVWYIPRVVLSAVASVAMIPLSFGKRRKELYAEAQARWPFLLVATFVAFFGAALASFAPVLDGNFHPLQPVLRDNFWLLIHVLTIVSSYGAGALAWGLANIALGYYLFGKYRATELTAIAGHRPAAATGGAILRRPPEQAIVLSGYIYKAMQVAVVLLAAGTILGALWADVAWGRFWGWDPKEVWALISLLIYLAVLHGRYAGWFGNFGLCVGSVLGFSAIVMSWYGVNFVLGIGLHSYGFGAGGQYSVFGAVALNWAYLAICAYWYLMQTHGTLKFWSRASESDSDGGDGPGANSNGSPGGSGYRVVGNGAADGDDAAEEDVAEFAGTGRGAGK